MKKTLILAFCTAAVLTACGGGDDDDTPAAAPTPAVTEAVPPTASASVGGLIGYLSALVVAMADTLEPVDVSAVTPPVDDAGEPSAVN